MKDCFFGRRENPDLIPRKITYQAGLGENFSWGDGEIEDFPATAKTFNLRPCTWGKAAC